MYLLWTTHYCQVLHPTYCPSPHPNKQNNLVKIVSIVRLMSVLQLIGYFLEHKTLTHVLYMRWCFVVLIWWFSEHTLSQCWVMIKSHESPFIFTVSQSASLYGGPSLATKWNTKFRPYTSRLPRFKSVPVSNDLWGPMFIHAGIICKRRWSFTINQRLGWTDLICVNLLVTLCNHQAHLMWLLTA